jgi:type VI secretion system protein ImpC
VRKLPEASSLGLALPRFLLRQPYGQRSEPIDGFPFEELPDGSAHEAYLWGNPAILCGFVLADAFQAEGWEMQAEGSGEVGDLPVYKFTEEGETKVKPCAEAWLSEHGGEAILSQGLMPLLSIKGRDAVRLGELRSVSSSTSRLNGRWG